MQIVERDFSMYYSKLYSLETEVNRILYEPWLRRAAKTFCRFSDQFIPKLACSATETTVKPM